MEIEPGALATILQGEGEPWPSHLEDVLSALRRLELVAGARSDAPEIVRHILRQVASAPDRTAALATLHVSELSLAFLCSLGEPAALRVLEATYLVPLDRLLTKTSAGWTADLQQVFRQKLIMGTSGAPALAAYSGRGALRSWLKVTATRVLLSATRGASSQRTTGEENLVDLPDGSNPELSYFRQAYGAAFKEALAEAAGELGPADRNVLRYAFVERLDADGIAAIYGIHRTTAGRKLSAAREALLKGTRRALKQRLRLSDREFDSVVRVVRSHLEITFERLLAEDPLPKS